ncbi:MAG: type III-A CRISPR-associated protein Csm2, partial [Methanosarcinales archaeon]|nr:type III-A CRISPR-associated protein Csm2 [Methanosarcinales archaeon]
MTEIRDIIKKIDSLQNLSELDEKTIAEENGYAESVARDRDIKRRLKTTQLRKIFDRVKTIERNLNEHGWDDDVRSNFYMLRPELAYAKARKLIPEQFFRLMDACMKQVDKGDNEQKRSNYARFVRFLEAIVAYHKYHE